ncbi:aminoglycoside phosphotransferase family protein [Acidicapsa ligni]|uniref:aminoglycoside phosphotransferase family protein n=1 Tax=Acidicapsa ligni TaxID=542300 RepID=UPI0021DF5DD8|nr:aminoglycoside phosphotransferase family protein [Acidicapsa ligni]
MPNVPDQVETRTYALALIGPNSDGLMGLSGVHGVQLPHVEIPKWTRVAEEINLAVRKRWGLDSLVLELLPSQNGAPDCVLAEVIGQKSGSIPEELSICDLDVIEGPEITPGTRDALRTTITGNGSAKGPFSRRGWLIEARDWIEQSAGNGKATLSGVFRQYNASESFALVRFERLEGQAIWLKATGVPNAHEFDVTVRLSQLFPDFLPQLIAARSDWNAWITEDAGTSLGACQDLPTLVRAVEVLADLQIESLGEIDMLKAAGCMDRSLRNVHTNLGQMFDFLDEAMKLQVSTKSKPLSSARLREISEVVDEACTAMLGLGIPPCLVNGDINLDNILFDGVRYRFIDWAEVGIGNPFLTLQQVIQHVIRDDEHQEWAPVLRAAYRAKWLWLLSGDQIDRAFSLMPLLTIVDYLYGRGEWLLSERRDETSFQSFARTLGRCMDRAAAELSSKGAIQS